MRATTGYAMHAMATATLASIRRAAAKAAAAKTANRAVATTVAAQGPPKMAGPAERLRKNRMAPNRTGDGEDDGVATDGGGGAVRTPPAREGASAVEVEHNATRQGPV